MLYNTSLNWPSRISTALICNNEEGKFWTALKETILVCLFSVKWVPVLDREGREIWTAKDNSGLTFALVEWVPFSCELGGWKIWMAKTYCAVFYTSLNWLSKMSTAFICNNEEGKVWTALKKTILVCFILVKWVPFSLETVGREKNKHGGIWNGNEFHGSNTIT